MAKKTGSKKERIFGKLSEQKNFLERKIKKAVKNNDDYAFKKYNYHLTLTKETMKRIILI